MVMALTSLLPAARAFYAPAEQRWVQRDPLGDYGATPWTPKLHYLYPGPWEKNHRVNLYGFIDNRPVGGVDPYGLDVIDAAVLFGRTAACGQGIKEYVWENYGKKSGPNDPSARVAHCIAHCLIAGACPGGPATSWVGGLAKEIEDWFKKRFGGRGDGYDSGDMAANSLGRQFAKCPGKTCEEQCQGALNDGSLYPRN